MISGLPQDKRKFLELRRDLTKIQKECPVFVEWLQQSFEETIDVVGAITGAELEKETGALRDIKTILRSIANPPEIPVILADDMEHGMGLT